MGVGLGPGRYSGARPRGWSLEEPSGECPEGGDLEGQEPEELSFEYN